MKHIQYEAAKSQITRANHLELVDETTAVELAGSVRYDLAGAEMSAIETLEERGIKITSVPGLSDGLQQGAFDLLAAYAAEPIAFMEQLGRTHLQPKTYARFLKSLEGCTALAERDVNEEPQTAA